MTSDGARSDLSDQGEIGENRSINGPMVCDGPTLRKAFVDAAALLRARSEAINALNVFPVPDGDTGTNMSLTMQEAVRRTHDVADSAISAVVSAAAHGALLGARGNSGVILSQYLRGLARGLDGKSIADAADLAKALQLAAQTAYSAVVRPVEGTMLTVGQDAATAAVDAVPTGLVGVLEAAATAARSSVARTPSLMSVLQQAGVVDAGGEGLYTILEGMWRSLRGDAQIDDRSFNLAPAMLTNLHSQDESGFGYCTELLVEGNNLDVDAVRDRIITMGESALVVGDANLVRVHVHTHRPGLIIEYGTDLGVLRQVSVENMDQQFRQRKESVTRPPAGVTGVVAVGTGPGIVRVLESLGAHVVGVGQVANPSTDDLLRAVEEVGAQQVIILPNNGNVLLAAQQVCLLTKKQTAVVPTKNVVEGIIAMTSFDGESDLATNTRLMTEASQSARTAEITTAIRAAKIDSLEIPDGSIIAIVDGKLVLAARTFEEAIGDLLPRLGAEAAEVISIFYGQGVSRARVDQVVQFVRERFQQAQVEVVDGGQPLYPILISVE